jgi:carbonic anhydrase/acetyltransferase-like protein (isoleucine patch superfamily)
MNTAPEDDPSHPGHEEHFLARVREHLGTSPVVPASAYVAPGVFLTGAVTLGERASLWPFASLRADISAITVGEESNIQDNAVIHVGTGMPAVIGRRVTVGHGAIVHACTVGDGTLVGMGAVLLDGAVIGENCLIGARTLVLGGTVIPPGSMVVGSPGKIVRTLSPKEQAGLGVWADHYVVLAREYAARGIGGRCAGGLSIA